MATPKILKIAKICHEVNRAFCDGIEGETQVSWEEASDHIKQTVIDGVIYIRKNPSSTPKDAHDNWLDFKIDEGWVYGPTKDPVKKTHPLMIRYKDLPKQQKAKDMLFSTVVKSFK